MNKIKQLMDKTHKLQWDKLKAELDLLSIKDPSSITPLLLQVDELISDHIDLSSLSRKINFSCYHLMNQCENLLEPDRILILNDFFFSEKNYQLHKSDHSQNAPLLSNTFTEYRGNSLHLALSYLHFASHLDLPIYLIQLPNTRLLKWVRSEKVNYIDLHQAGKVISEEDIIEIINFNFPKTVEINSLQSELFHIKPTQDILSQYLDDLITFYAKDHDLSNYKTLLDIKIKMNPADIKSLTQRALILKQWGQSSQALKDFKKIFSFVNIDHLSPELKMAYHELKTQELNPSPLIH